MWQLVILISCLEAVAVAEGIFMVVEAAEPVVVPAVAVADQLCLVQKIFAWLLRW